MGVPSSQVNELRPTYPRFSSVHIRHRRAIGKPCAEGNKGTCGATLFRRL
jgi:hypothetical protein